MLAWSPPAIADDTPGSPPTTTVPTRAPERDGHHFVFGQALALLVRRVSIGYELLPGVHHSFGITLHGQSPGTGVPSLVKGGIAGGGGEIGYRYYTGARGPYGPFVGTSFLSGYYVSRSSFYEDVATTTYAQYGLAIDMGWATDIDRTFTLAVGIGAQRTWIDVDRRKLSDYGKAVAGEGVRPRAMVQVGRAF